ncbi:hypothetical protein KSF_106900 [Reticulibacter mediterranei]|uniref:Pentapeptide repeat-containing protein n=1 Tax=Reticulibacter mediterranei TaxID=2778369 RepID=A0A8J3N6R6_9CHLR|nr:hypothetical protein KSF_106900 [Reticulibacter mediterranei]
MDLEGFDFTGAMLQEANLTGSNLSHANFTRANLSRVEGRQVQMQYAVLCEAEMTDAIFARADLSHANLHAATLTRADFTRATFSHATCSWVSAMQATFADAVLTASLWNKANLVGACLNYAQGTQASFARANLTHATVRHAVLNNAILTEAKCGYGDWLDTSLQAASLVDADFSFSNLRDIDVEDASLRDCRCESATFGRGLHYNAKTTIDSNNHDLISMVLLSCAHTAEQKQFALYIRYETNLCWAGFTRLLLRQPAEMAAWVKESLRTVDSLKSSVEEFENRFQQWLSAEERSVSLCDLNPSLHHFMNEQIKKHDALRADELYWFLRGVLASACQNPEMAVSEEYHGVVLERLRELICS